MSEAREEQASGSASPAAQLPSKDETPITPAIKTEAEGTPESPPLLRRSTRQAAKFAKTPVYPQQAEEHDESDAHRCGAANMPESPAQEVDDGKLGHRESNSSPASKCRSSDCRRTSRYIRNVAPSMTCS